MSAALSKLKSEIDHAIALKGQGDVDAALAFARKIASKNPNVPAVNYVLGGLLLDTGNHKAAIKSFKKTLKADPSYGPAYLGLGIAEEKLGHYGPAEKAFLRVLERSPDSIPALFQISRLYSITERYQESEPYLLRGLQLNDQVADFYYYLSIVRHEQKDIPECMRLAQRAVELNPTHKKAQLFLTKLNYYSGKYDDAVSAAESAIKHNDSNVELCVLYADILFELGLHEKAALAYQRMLDFLDDDLDKMIALITCYLALKRYSSAEEVLDRAYRHDSDNVVLDSIGLNLAQNANNFSDFKKYQGKFPDFKKYLEFQLSAEPLFFMYFLDDLELLYEFCKNKASGVYGFYLKKMDVDNIGYREKVDIERTHNPVVLSGSREAQRRLRVGFISEDFRSHPVGYVFNDIFSHIDKDKIESHVFSYGPPSFENDSIHKMISERSEYWYDISRSLDDLVCSKIKSLDLDVLVDCTGWTGNSRSYLLSNRLAKFQVSWLGYPGTMGSDWLDYIVVDGHTVPKENEAFFTEQVLRLDQFLLSREYAIQTEKKSRADYGLPEDKFIFNAYNGNIKITSDMFEVWMRLLQQCDDSVIVFNLNADCKVNLVNEAGRFGIGEDRLFFFGFVETIEDHRLRCSLTDVFLDTYPYGAHVTVLDMLYAGLPVVTLEGRTMSSRVGASALRYLGQASTIAQTPEDYFRIAHDLWADSDQRNRLKRSITETIANDNPFSPKRYAAKFQDLLLSLGALPRTDVDAVLTE